jgi:hypothetical protein
MLFLEALIAILGYDLCCLVWRFHNTHAIARRLRVRGQPRPDTIERVCAAINYACVWYPKQVLCLQRSFVTTYLLRRHGVAAHMVLGAQKIPFKAHAWVEVDGRAINERSDVQATYAIWDRC